MVVPEGNDTIVEDFWGPPTVLPHGGRLYVTYQLGGPSTIRAFTLDGQKAAAPEIASVSAIGAMAALPAGQVTYSSRSYTAPNAWYRFDPATGQTEQTRLATVPAESLNDIRVEREFATSKDGTRVPVNVLVPRGVAPDHTAPCIINGYGGYGVNVQPRFRITERLLADHGVVYAVANLRGGGEYGEAWHRQGNLTHKQNVFDDFAASVRHLVEMGYCAADRVAILGGSNGGLLMGATMTQHPALARAVISFVGIYDMLRVELSPNGAFNIPEFGTVTKPDHFQALHAYSPYHNVADAVAYPPTLMLTGENDPRVDPMQSRKMTARLQAATTSSAPILLRTSSDAGHGGDTKLSERIEQMVDVMAFVFHELGVTFGEPVLPPRREVLKE